MHLPETQSNELSLNKNPHKSSLWAYPPDVDWFRLEEAVTVSEVVKPSKSHLGTSFTELSAEALDSSESPEADPLKTALPKKVRSSNGKKL